MALASVARTATQGSTGSGMLGGDEDTIDAAEACTPGRKRKGSGPLPSNKNIATRQKITRACDSCKVKKTRCNGTLPCTRCTRLSLPCEYNAAYSRGLPPDPLPASGDHSWRRTSDVGRMFSDSHAGGSSTGVLPVKAAVTSHQMIPSQRHLFSLRNSPEPGSTDFEGNYLGPASGVSFINRVWSRLHQDDMTRIPDDLQNESSRNTAVFMFGDKPYTYHGNSDFALPSLDKAMELITIYFDFSMVTYRFLHRGIVENWVKEVYENNVSVSNLPAGNMVARTAIVLMIFAVSTLHRDAQPGSVADGLGKR